LSVATRSATIRDVGLDDFLRRLLACSACVSPLDARLDPLAGGHVPALSMSTGPAGPGKDAKPMGLRERSDVRSVSWVVLAVAVVALQYAWPVLIPVLCPVGCYLAAACGTICHNHNHNPTFRSRRLNRGFGHVLSVFYGYPTLMWIPTHILNHHRFTNRAGDATITWRHSNLHNFVIAATYPFVSAYHQAGVIREFIHRTKSRNPKLYGQIVFQYGFWIGVYAALLALALVLHGRGVAGVYVWFMAVMLPALFSVTVIMVFNYIQHVHADAWSEFDHSRNFTSPSFNWLFFNNGFHTVHHEQPGLHWSRLPEAHAALAPRIDPRLNESSLWWFAVRQYLLAPLFPGLGTSQIGPFPGAAAEPPAAG
jgi:fatty acid desaturase